MGKGYFAPASPGGIYRPDPGTLRYNFVWQIACYSQTDAGEERPKNCLPMAGLPSPYSINPDESVGHWGIQLRSWSRNPHLLGFIAGAILVSALVLAWKKRGPDALATSTQSAALQAELARSAPDFESAVRRMREIDPGHISSALVIETIRNSTLSESEKAVMTTYWESLSAGFSEPVADLLYYAHYIKPLEHANELVGDLHLARDNIEKAVAYYERELRFGSARAGKKLISVLLEKEDHDGIGRFMANRALVRSLPPEVKLLVAGSERRWTDLVEPIEELQLATFKPMPLMLAISGGLVWFVVALQALQTPGIFSFRSIAPLLAVAAGMISTAPALFASVWQNEVMHFRNTGEFTDAIVLFIAGVGPREELIKLVFIVPFLPFFISRENRLEMLVVSGCVGLGFAVEENLQCFAQAGPAVTFGRLLSANFFHFAATGLVGLAFCDMLRQPVKKALAFGVTLLAVMFAHGCYDAFMVVGELRLLNFISMISFMLLALAFFRKVRGLRDGSTDQLGLGATLIIGLALFTGAVVVCASRELGFRTALLGQAAILVTLLMIVQMFYWQLGDGAASADRPSVR